MSMNVWWCVKAGRAADHGTTVRLYHSFQFALTDKESWKVLQTLHHGRDDQTDRECRLSRGSVLVG